jgi:hypothetical protein
MSVEGFERRVVVCGIREVNGFKIELDSDGDLRIAGQYITTCGRGMDALQQIAELYEELAEMRL